MRSGTKFAAALVAAALAFGAVLTASAGESPPRGSARAPAGRRWDAAAADVFARLPVQDGGRVKPLSTFAGFTLLSLNGRRGCATPAGESLDPTRWLMDCLFFPEEATRYECFVVQTADVLDALGLAHEGKSRRDRYSYADLAPARERLFELAREYSAVDERRRNAVQGQVLNLARNFQDFESVAGLLGTMGEPPAATPAIVKVFGAGARPRVADLLDRAADVEPWIRKGNDPHRMGMGGGDHDPMLSGWVDDVIGTARGIALIPPAPGSAEWLTPSDVVAASLRHREDVGGASAALRELDAMYAARGDADAFLAHARAFSDVVTAAARERGEYGRIPLEVAFYRAQFFHWSQVVFVLGFLLVAFSWLKPAKWLTRGTVASVVLATLLLAAGITMRCLIRGRPPVTTLYESILFVTAVGVIAALAAEHVHRRGIALALSTVVGAAGMFLANRYEVQEHVDTMPSLVAVLDTNFWLASHVTTVTIGYGAGILAGLVGHVHVLGRVLGRKRGDPGFYKTLSTMTYGMLAFSLVFSIVGTVLGGIWANESWGRFWGWDPKENGALVIVLWQLMVLHARIGGYIRDFGVAMASVFGTAVVASSWWGVNLLGVGLHSYGFTSGILIALLAFYGVEALVLAAGGVHWALGRTAAPAGTAAAGSPRLPESQNGAAA